MQTPSKVINSLIYSIQIGESQVAEFCILGRRVWMSIKSKNLVLEGKFDGDSDKGEGGSLNFISHDKGRRGVTLFV